MTSVAEPILQTKFSELQAQARKTWNGLEREAVIEIVRAADYAAYIIQCSSEGPDTLDKSALDDLRLILIEGMIPRMAQRRTVPVCRDRRWANWRAVKNSVVMNEAPKE